MVFMAPSRLLRGLRRERVLASPRYIKGAFRNTARVGAGLKSGTTVPVLRDFVRGRGTRRPPAPLSSIDPRPGWTVPNETGLRATWLGHSTVLVEVDGARVLTDPVWSDRVSPVNFAGPKRFQPVPVAIADLPPLDALVISHDHYDHLDRASVLELSKRNVPVITSLGVGAHLESWGIPADRITELDWWESAMVPNTDVEITAAPSQHFSGRAINDRNHTLWSSMALRGPKHRVFFSGDTGLTQEYTQINERLGPFDLVMLEIGAFHPAWGDIHLGPDNALKALDLLGGGRLLPVHWGTFDLAVHSWDDPIETLWELADDRGAALTLPRLGEAVEPDRAVELSTWWRTVKG